MRISTIAFANLKRRKGKALFLIGGIAVGIGTAKSKGQRAKGRGRPKGKRWHIRDGSVVPDSVQPREATLRQATVAPCVNSQFNNER